MQDLIVLNNEKVSKQNGKFFSRNYNFKILPEGLNRYFKVEYIVRKSEVKESHDLNLDKIKILFDLYYTLYFYCVFIFVHFQKKSLCIFDQ